MKKILYLGYELPVMPFFSNPLIVNPVGTNNLVSSCPEAKKILAVERSESLRDALARSVHLFNIFKIARGKLLNQDRAANTLPIFMAPEFYFRKENAPYTKNTFYALIDHWKAMSKKYPHWVFVPGTVWWGDHTSFAGKAALVVHNSVVVIRDGIMIHTYLKQLPSGFDKLLGANEGQFWDGDATNQLVDSNELSTEFKRKTLGNILLVYNNLRKKMRQDGTDTNLFTHDGLSFGIEICLDHAGGFLKTELNSRRTVDVHLEVGCGMGCIKKNVMAKNGGVFLRVDGTKKPLSQAYKVQGSDQTNLVGRGEITNFNDPISRQLAAIVPGVPECVRIFETVIL